MEQQSRYTEIFRLKEMLENAGIPFEYRDNSVRQPNFTHQHYQICYPMHLPEGRAVSVIEGDGTYGGEEDKLEIMGLLTPDEAADDSVVGWLTAEDVFGRINHQFAERR